MGVVMGGDDVTSTLQCTCNAQSTCAIAIGGKEGESWQLQVKERLCLIGIRWKNREVEWMISNSVN